MIPALEIVIPTYIIFATIGALVSVIFLYYRMDKFTITFKQLLVYIPICIICMIFCSKLLYAIAMISIDYKNFLIYFVNGGIVFYGGMYGILLGILIISKIRKDNCTTIYNFAVPAIPLFHIFGRIGCLFGGCCYGIKWKWGVIMAATPDIVRFPVQIVESICNIFIFTSLIIISRKDKNKKLLPIYLFEYAICRFVLEFFRGDGIRGIWWIFSTSQIISIITLLTLFIWLIYEKRKNRIKSIQKL